MSHGVIDLRSRRKPRKPVSGHRSLFSSTPPEQKAKKPRSLRARRRRARLLVASAIFIVLALAAWGVSVVSYLPRFTIAQVEVAGTADVSPQVITEYVGTILHDGTHRFLSRANIFLYPRAQIEEGIVSHFPPIASARATLDSAFSTHLTITVEPRQVFALWCGAASSTVEAATTTAPVAPDHCYDMDEHGYLFASAPQGATSSATYVFRGGLGPALDGPQVGMGFADPIGRTFAAAHLPGLMQLLTALAQAGFTPTEVTVEDAADFTVQLAQGFSLKASFGEDPARLTQNLQLALGSDALQGKADQLEYVDLRFGDRVYYKLRGASETSGTTSGN